MPDPDPQPAKPRSVSVARWLLLLTPSMPLLVSPSIADAWSRAHHIQGEATVGPALVTALFSFPAFIVLSFVLGFRLEKWTGGNRKSWLRPIGCGFLILILNFLIAFAGCRAIESMSRQ